ncbi:hypothetical protein LguiB_024273 [Lonicera macranthoides]
MEAENNLQQSRFSLPAPNTAPIQLLNLPPGYRFKPYDTELILFYLKRKVEGQPLPANCINEVNIYTYDPQTLEDQYKPVDGNEMYFFTPRDRKYKNGTRPDRAAEGGYWKASGKDIEIKFRRDVVGKKKTLVFYGGRPPHGNKTSWIMHEYRLNNDPLPSGTGENGMKLDDYVLCRIHNNKRNKKSGEVGENQVNKEEAQIEDTEGHVSYGEMPAAAYVDNVNMPVRDLTAVLGYGNIYQTMRMESNFNGYENPLGFFSSNHLPSTLPQAYNPNTVVPQAPLYNPPDEFDYSFQMVAPLSLMEYDVVNQYPSTSAYPLTSAYNVPYTPSTMQRTPSTVQKEEIHAAEGSLYNKEQVFKAQEQTEVLDAKDGKGK